MNIRSRLLLYLLPTLAAFVGLIALFFYFNWSQEILNSFKSRLQSIVVTAAYSIPEQEVAWITEHLNDPNLKTEPRYLAYKQKLKQLQQKLPLVNLYIVRIEPVKEGDFVLPNDPQSQVRAGLDGQNAYRQVFLLDAGDSQDGTGSDPGDVDFSETDEHQIYFTKKALVTPIYEARKTQERFMSAYAPILDSQGNVTALLGADVSMHEIDQKLNKALLIIFLGAATTIFLVITTVFFIADRISQPVRKLNQAALEIAAGHYDANITVKGPREIVELANTLNTMSECLVENINRLKETSLIRERMYGEYECALLLQYYMLQKAIEDFRHPHIQVRYAAVNYAMGERKGVLVRFDETSPDLFKLAFMESNQTGFAALYQLIQASSKPLDVQDQISFIECQWTNTYSRLNYRCHNMWPPLVWSMRLQQFMPSQSPSIIDLQNGDMIFLCNTDLTDYFQSLEKLEKWLGKILRHFAEDGLENIQLMISHELNFLAKRENLKNNFYILSLQIKIPTQNH